MAPEAPAQPTLSLPPLVMTPADVSRLRRELEALDNYLRTQALREPGMPVEQLPKLSRMLDDLAEVNKINLLHTTARADLKTYLANLQQHASIVHISFAADPSSASLQKLVLWLRQNIRADILVHVGLQPNIVAGCVLRTTNRYFDFSLQHFLKERRQFLVDALISTAASKAPEVPHE